MSNEDWIFNKLPRGEDLPISCTYEFSKGKRIADPTDIPVGWEMEWIKADASEIREAGFKPAVVYTNGLGEVSLEPKPGFLMGSYLFLRDQDGNIVATWDEGRWWTKDESAAFHLMAVAPGAYVMAEQKRFEQLPRRYRRKLK